MIFKMTKEKAMLGLFAFRTGWKRMRGKEREEEEEEEAMIDRRRLCMHRRVNVPRCR